MPLQAHLITFYLCRLMAILHEDNEENAELALQILSQPVYTARRDGAPQGLLISYHPAGSMPPPSLVDFCLSVIEATKRMRELVKQEESWRQS